MLAASSAFACRHSRSGKISIRQRPTRVCAASSRDTELADCEDFSFDNSMNHARDARWLRIRRTSETCGDTRERKNNQSRACNGEKLRSAAAAQGFEEHTQREDYRAGEEAKREDKSQSLLETDPVKRCAEDD